jgi:hypothetical protein
MWRTGIAKSPTEEVESCSSDRGARSGDLREQKKWFVREGLLTERPQGIPNRVTVEKPFTTTRPVAQAHRPDALTGSLPGLQVGLSCSKGLP